METANKTKPKTPWVHKDIYQEVTDKIILQLEMGHIPWYKPWNAGDDRALTIPKNFTSGNKYRGINIVLLWSAAIENHYATDEWASFKQWNEKKEAVRKGEKGTMIVYYDTFEKEVNGEIEKIPFLKSSIVFNKSQLASYVPEEPKTTENKVMWEEIAAIEDFVNNCGAIIEQTGDRAFYSHSTDKITMPYPEYFVNTPTCTATEGYYSVLLHELTHWTGCEKRLNRTKSKKFADQNYANEELIAEFGAAFLCAGFGIANEEKTNHAAYIENWLEVLRNDKKCLFIAASEASKAVDYLYSIKP